ncbi:MAG: insulinase family protein [Carboxylicivirga sp.]|nr:insulinase family protein [Carboxylicivirga sp.]
MKNGFTYYLRKSDHPAGRATIYLAQRVGSDYETESESGYAHFLEHMAFNGTKHFPGRKGVVKAVADHGLIFGKNINAITNTQATKYWFNNLNAQDDELIDKCLTIVYDWCNGIEINDEQIDIERNIIIKERNKVYREPSLNQLAAEKALLNGLTFADKQPIGQLESIENVNAEKLIKFYNKWYRTDKQALIIVGDIDVDKIEDIVKTKFESLPSYEEVTPEYQLNIPNNETVNCVNFAEEQAGAFYISYNKRFQFTYANSKEYFRTSVLRDITSALLNARIKAIKSQHTDLLGSSIGFSKNSLKQQYYHFEIGVSSNSNQKLFDTWDRAVQIWEDIRRNGFTEKEIKVIIDNSILNAEKIIASDEQNTDQMAASIAESFIQQQDYLDNVQYCKRLIKLLQQISPEDIKQVIEQYEAFGNASMIVSGQKGNDFMEAKTLLAKKDSLQSLNTIWKFEREKVDFSKVLNESMEPGAVVEKNNHELVKAKVYTLSNGIKVIYHKHSRYGGKIHVNAIAPALYEQYSYDRFAVNATANYADYGTYTKRQIQNALYGEIEDLTFNCGIYSDEITASSSIDNLELMMGLITARGEKMKVDGDARKSITDGINILTSKEFTQTTMKTRQNMIDQFMTRFDPRLKSESYSINDNYNADELLSLYRMGFAPDRFTWVFTGNLSERKFLEVMNKTLANAKPGNFEYTKEQGLPFAMRSGKKTKRYKIRLKQGINSVNIKYWDNIKPTDDTENIFKIAQNALYQKLLNKLREEMQGVYAFRNTNRLADDKYFLDIDFDCQVEHTNELIAAARKIISQASINGFTQDEFTKAKIAVIEEEKGKVRNVLDRILQFELTGEDIYNIDNTIKAFEKVNFDVFNRSIQDILKADNRFTFIFDHLNYNF